MRRRRPANTVLQRTIDASSHRSGGRGAADKARFAYGKQCAIGSAGCQGVSEPCSVSTFGCQARDEVRSRPTADYRWWLAGTNRTCPIHGVAMLEDRVPLCSGPGSGFEHSLDEKEGEVAAIKRTHSA